MTRLNRMFDFFAASGGLGRPTGPQRNHIQQQQAVYDALPNQQKMLFEANLWIDAINQPGTALKADILKRIFVLLRCGGLFFRPQVGQAWRTWSSTGWPIASALSHGCRVMVQLPMRDPRSPNQADDRFFDWLTANSVANGQNGITRQRSGTHSTGNRINNLENVGNRHVKVLQELKSVMHGAGQSLGSSVGRSYGVNIALGGNGNVSPYDPAGQRLIMDDGCYGHLYLFYRPPAADKFGGMLIGCEGEEDGKWGVAGNFHSWNLGPVDSTRGYRGSDREAFFGPKWKDPGFQFPDQRQGGQLINGPGNYDCLLIDLTSGWEFLQNAEANYRDDWVRRTSAGLRSAPNPAHHLAANAVPQQYAATWNGLPDEALGVKLYFMVHKFGLPATNTVVAAYCNVIY